MTDFKIFGYCTGCRRYRFFVRRGKVTLPTGHVATSQQLLCKQCITSVRANIK